MVSQGYIISVMIWIMMMEVCDTHAFLKYTISQYRNMSWMMILEQVWMVGEDTLVQLHCPAGLSKACPDNGCQQCTASKWKKKKKCLTKK